jgi:hypothetical protein
MFFCSFVLYILHWPCLSSDVWPRPFRSRYIPLAPRAPFPFPCFCTYTLSPQSQCFSFVLKKKRNFTTSVHNCTALLLHKELVFWTALSAYSGPRTITQFRNHFSQTVGLLERVISPSQGRYLHTGQLKHRMHVYRHKITMSWVVFEHTGPTERKQYMP